MSNYLAIAAVTATLQKILQDALQLEMPGARVTTVKPESNSSNIPEFGVNIYLYQVIPNRAWRNADLRTRRPKGDLIKHAQAGLDLYYIMTFYGNEVEFEPQCLLGSTVRTIIDNPILSPQMIQETLSQSFSNRLNSRLDKRVEQVTVVPSNMNTEELSKIWSVFFQSPYVLSFACQASTILIAGDKPSARALPVKRVDFYTTANQPIISQIISDGENNQPVSFASKLTIQGQQLAPDIDEEELPELDRRTNRRKRPLARIQPQVKIGKARLTPQNITENEIDLDLASLTVEEKSLLLAGVQSLQIVYSMAPKLTLIEPERVIVSNAIPFILCPTITTEVTIEELEDDGDDLYSGKLNVEVDVTVNSQQRVFLFLNEKSFADPASYIFVAVFEDYNVNCNLLKFPIRDVKGGEYLVRVQIDGAESSLDTDANEQFIGPSVNIGSVVGASR
ncbi:DUF4255 domain-containing protein [Mastigocoleus testarum]|uniref:Pvc16 N-terminal domain-containing protein n=1 Tax=Mastigocoleus testarum BC008 TaxID=371196 RepID=A0A0V7ZTA2_9CYAN|nr:DUF4255 domain-containing protein [Mastigocoleus testarum]KST67694.1 hypothetical protein BC008_43845 [Mastigocoleus testarum BC008]